MISLSIADLKPALTGLAKVVSSKASLPCLQCVRVDASPDRVTLTGTDLDMFATLLLPEATCDAEASFLVPLDRLQSATKRFSSRTVLNISPDSISADLGTGRVSEAIESLPVEEFPVEPSFEAKPVPMPESFARRFTEAMGCSSTDATRYVLNGISLDTSDPASHYMVGTDGRHLFSANSFTLPESLTIPNHKLLLWRGLVGLPWSLASQKKKESQHARIVAGDWTLTMKTIEGTYPNWRQVIPRTEDMRTTVTLPEGHEFAKLVAGLPGGDTQDKPVDLVVTGASVALRDTVSQSSIPLEGAKAKGPDIRIRLNRDYLTKAFTYGLNHIGLIDSMSPLHFTCEGRQMVVMPMRVADEIATTATSPAQPEPQPAANQPAPSEPQHERKTMTETNGHHTNGGATPHINGVNRSTTPESPAPEKPAIEVAIEKLDAFKATFREALISVTEITTLLKQSVRDQKAGEKEIHQVRQTLRSLQSVKL